MIGEKFGDKPDISMIKYGNNNVISDKPNENTEFYMLLEL